MIEAVPGSQWPFPRPRKRTDAEYVTSTDRSLTGAVKDSQPNTLKDARLQFCLHYGIYLTVPFKTLPLVPALLLILIRPYGHDEGALALLVVVEHEAEDADEDGGVVDGPV